MIYFVLYYIKTKGSEMEFQPESLPAYVISNENQRWATSAVSGIKRVLTVAGSGDQAIFYKLAGAKIVDTFDITRNAGAIQDIKYAAIKNLGLTEYKTMLSRLYMNMNIMDVPQIRYLNRFLDDNTRQTIKQNSTKNMFSAGLGINEYPENIPTDAEYKKLKAILNKPFNFISCDLSQLSAKISGHYDLINLSNIFDYCYDAGTQAKILSDLSEHLRIGGHIVYLPQMRRFNYERVLLSKKNGPELVYKKTVKYQNTTAILFQRTR